MKYKVKVAKCFHDHKRHLQVLVAGSMSEDLNLGQGEYERMFEVECEKEFKVHLCDGDSHYTFLFEQDCEHKSCTHTDGPLTVECICCKDEDEDECCEDDDECCEDEDECCEDDE